MKTKRVSIFLIITILLVLTSCDIFPYVAQPPADAPQAIITPTPHSTPTSQPATSTAEPTPTKTMLPVEITPTINNNPTISPPAFQPQKDNPFYLVNFNHPEEGCEWMGVAGQVFDELGNEITGVKVLAGSALEGDTQEFESTTGLALAYGPAGYEIQLSESPINSSEIFWVQIFDQSDIPLSDQVYFDTFENCIQNLILLNFVASEESNNREPGTTETPPAYP